MKRLLPIIIGLLLITLYISYKWELKQSYARVETYVKLWESDLAQERLVQKSDALYFKIIAQLGILGVDVDSSGILSCYFAQTVTINFDLIRAGDIRICHRPSNVLLNTLTSPLTLLMIFVSLIFGLMTLRREAGYLLAQKELEHELHLQREIVVFARQVAHDIRSPLTALKMLVSVGQGMSADFKDLLQNSVLRMQNIADDLLETDKQRTTREFHFPIRLEALVKEWCLAHPTVHVHIEDEFKGSLQIDVVKFERIVSNLLNNCFEASADNVRIRIFLKESFGIFEIIDNGSGFKSEILHKIGKRGLTSKKSGHGMGLSDAIQTVESWGGTLVAENLEKGSRVELSLPKALFKRDA